MLNYEQINELSEYANCEVKLMNTSLNVVIRDVIEKALALAEKSKWKYPHKAEFPDDDQQIFYIAHGQNTFRTGIKKDSMVIENSTGRNYRFNIVKYWTYAPVLEEG